MCLAMALLVSPCACRRYGEAKSYDSMTPEMRAYHEDRVILGMGGLGKIAKMWKTVGVLGSEASGAAGSFVPGTISFFLSKHAF